MSANDYYPFGSAMAGRKYNQGTYRYGFNGKEEDKEWGSQMIQDYGFRIYNPTIGKFLSVDPLAPDYPWYTPYQFAGNKVIIAIDVDGLEPQIILYTGFNAGDDALWVNDNGKLRVRTFKEIQKLVAKDPQHGYHLYAHFFQFEKVTVVEKGMTLGEIGEIFNCTEKNLRKYNPFLAPQNIKIGEEVFLPPSEETIEFMMSYHDAFEAQHTLNLLQIQKYALIVRQLNLIQQLKEAPTVLEGFTDIILSVLPVVGNVKAAYEISSRKNATSSLKMYILNGNIEKAIDVSPVDDVLNTLGIAIPMAKGFAGFTKVGKTSILVIGDAEKVNTFLTGLNALSSQYSNIYSENSEDNEGNDKNENNKGDDKQ